jgi:hypothetical protein
MGVISYLSSFSTTTTSTIPLFDLKGPVNDLHFGVDVAVTFVFCLAIYALAMRVRLPAAQTQRYVSEALGEAEAVEPEPSEVHA